MVPYIDKIFAFCSIILVTLSSSIIPLYIKSYSKYNVFNLALGYSGGALLAGGLIHLLPEAREDWNNAIKEQKLNLNYPICEMLVIIGILLIIIVEQISNHLIEKIKHKQCKEKNENNCYNIYSNIFHYENKFDYINILNIIKNNKIEDNKIYCIHLKNVNYEHKDKCSIEKLCTGNFPKVDNINVKYKNKKKKKICDKIKLQETHEINSKYNRISIKHNKNMLISKLNEKKNQNHQNYKINNIHSSYDDCTEDDVIDGNIYFIQTFSGDKINENKSNDLLDYNLHRAPIILLLAFSFHSIIEGITLGSVKNSFVTIFSIISHKAFSSFSIGVNLINNNIKRKKYILYIVFFSLMTPLGILLGLIANIFASTCSIFQFFPPILESIGSGTFIYISLFEIIGPLLYTYKINNGQSNTETFSLYKMDITLFIFIGALSTLVVTWFF